MTPAALPLAFILAVLVLFVFALGGWCWKKARQHAPRRARNRLKRDVLRAPQQKAVAGNWYGDRGMQ